MRAQAEQMTLPQELKDAATVILRGNHAYRGAFIRYMASLEPLPLDRFWDLLERVKVEIHQYRYGYKRSNGVEQGADEFFRKALVGDGDYTMEECYRFTATYEQVVSRLSKRLGKLFEYCGDSFGDLIDSLPLAGREFCEQKFYSEEHLHDQIAHLPAPWNKFVGGEHYVEMSLEHCAKRRMLSVVCDQLPEDTQDVDCGF